jgi:dolichol-phosphate mannosyltransferase
MTEMPSTDRTSNAEAPRATIRPAPELSVIVPAYNECANVPIMVERLRVALAGIDWEVIFVDDDSPDGTAAAVRAIGEHDDRVRCIRRIGRRGLAGACLEGMLASQARFVAVIDGDLQHDETLLAAMLQKLRAGDKDLAVATRYDGAGSAEGLSSGLRSKISAYSNTLSQRLLNVELSDPMSGFFMLRRAVVEEVAPSLSIQGFKILLDIVTSKPGLRFVELPYTFRERQHGESKLDARVALDFIALLFAKRISEAISFRFLMFCFVGLTGVGVHMLTLLLLRDLLGLGFGPAQGIATLTAIAWNFVLNNALTYRDQRLAGWDFVVGLSSFVVICSIGAVSNAGVAYWIFSYDPDGWLAGLAGALMSATWNYVVSAAFVWRAR